MNAFLPKAKNSGGLGAGPQELEPLENTMKLLPVQRASELSLEGPQTQWLIEDLWGEQAVGILGGEPKCCKSFLALDIAVSVASKTKCLRQFPARRCGTVLLFPAEDSLAIVRQRLEGICAAASLSLQSLPIEVITAPTLRLDKESDRQLLSNTVQRLKPILLILDPLIRLHRLDENDASQVAGLLSFLRQLQRQFQLAVLLVHHARKGSNSSRPGQALRGSSELHGWGDSNLYMRRRGQELTLSTEHRAAPSRDHIPLDLIQNGSALSLSLLHPDQIEQQQSPAPQTQKSPAERICNVLAQLDQPVALQELRKLCAMRTASLCSVLTELCQQAIVTKLPKGYLLKDKEKAAELFPVSLSLPIQSTGNGNGKHET
jgi:hypothetical protein